ncbi:MAG: MarR family winged helix-turn-helix transcriptional regulator [Acidimicrobiales bacterium]
MSQTGSRNVPEHELDAPPWLRVESTLMATARRIREAYDAALNTLELNLTTASLLAYVAEQGPITQTALAERIGVGRAAAGSAIDRLEARGLLTRSADENDRRVWLVGVTVDGRETADRITDIDRRIRERLRHDVTRQERQHLASLLVRLQRNAVTATTEVVLGGATNTEPERADDG